MTVKDLCALDVTTKNMYSKLYQKLKQTVEPLKANEKDAIKKNENRTAKNRPGADIPGNCFRVYLTLNRKYEDSNYINAVFSNSFTRKDLFIMAQTPLPNTIEDFICLIYKENCTCIVTMDDLKDQYQNIGMYIPNENHALMIGNFKVSSAILEKQKHFTMRKMKISYKGTHARGERSVHHFQYTNWLSEKEIPENASDFVKFVKTVEQYGGDDKSQVLVHCLKANERSGLFCAIMIIMEKLDKLGHINISNTIRHMRTRRHSAIANMDQLQSCFQAARIYAKHFSIKMDDHERV